MRGIECGIKLKWFDVRDFKHRDYEYYERIENGDLNLVVPDKFVAFSGPSSSQRDPEGVRNNIINLHKDNINLIREVFLKIFFLFLIC